MYRDKLLELVSIGDTQARKMNFHFYYETPDGKRLGNVYLARWYEKEFNCWLPFVTAPSLMNEFKTALSNKTLNMDHNYSLDFIKRLKKEYEHVALLYSGGYDSQRILLDFIENNIRIDETVMSFYYETDDNMNEEYRENAFPSLDKYRDWIDKQTFLYPHTDELLKHWSDEYAFFKRPQCGTIIEPMSSLQIENFYNDATPYDYGVPKNIDKKLDMHTKGCFIIGKDKPQLVHYKDHWYVTFLDSAMNDRGGLLNLIYFWAHPGNVKTLIQQSKLFRSYLLDNNKVDLSNTLSFCKFYDQDELNYVIDRPDIFNADKKLGKNAKYAMEKGNILVADRWDIVSKYARCMEKFLEIFPECNSGFEDFANKGKFAWFIDIDNLEIYSQQELIPNGFEDVSTAKHQGVDYSEVEYKGFKTNNNHVGDRHITEINKLSDKTLANKLTKIYNT